MADHGLCCSGSLRKPGLALLILLVTMVISSAKAEPSKRLVNLRTVDQYLGMCLTGQNHKSAPSSEPQLHGQCQGYQGKSCCNANTAGDLHKNETWYRLRREHCGATKMSAECRSYFDKDLCFYECSPDVGPWLEQDNRRWRQERMLNVPFCRSQCQRWFDSCARDYTCADNWFTGFQWQDGQNVCPSDRNCVTFQEMFKDAKNFCEKIWDGSYKVVDDGVPCMSFPADDREAMNNTEVARQRAKELLWRLTKDPNRGTRAGSAGHLLLAVIASGLLSLSPL